MKRDLGLSDARIAFLYGTAFTVFSAVFGIPFGRVADAWVRKNVITIGLYLLLEPDDGGHRHRAPAQARAAWRGTSGRPSSG